MRARVRGRFAPAIGLAAVVLLLVSAHFHESWWLKPPPCSLRTFTGIPCAGCGGTRAMQVLSQGDFLAALRFNPLATVTVIAAAGWFAAGVLFGPFHKAEHRQRNAGDRRWGILIGLAIFLNWIYLIFFLPG